MIGGGNTALDAIRSALRLGARKAYVIYRRSDAEMPARAEEVHHARQEGIDFQMLTAPVEFLSDGKGWLTAARCVRMEFGEPDSSGRRRPVPIKGSEFDLAPIRRGHGDRNHRQSRSCKAPRRVWAQTNAVIFRPIPKRSAPRAQESSPAATSSPGAATVILAMGAGRRAAKSIHDYLTKGQW